VRNRLVAPLVLVDQEYGVVLGGSIISLPIPAILASLILRPCVTPGPIIRSRWQILISGMTSRGSPDLTLIFAHRL
jgi:hypothetical protein